MLYRDALVVDFGPEFIGQVFKVGGGIVCVVPDHPTDRDVAGAAMRDLVRGLGGNCGDCRRCPFGQAG